MNQPNILFFMVDQMQARVWADREPRIEYWKGGE